MGWLGTAVCSTPLRWFASASSMRRVLFALAAVCAGTFVLASCVADPPPRIGTAVAGDSQATVTWQPPVAALSPVTGYRVTPWIGSTRQTPIVFNSTATTQVVTGLTDGVTYTFTVVAINARGDESAS